MANNDDMNSSDVPPWLQPVPETEEKVGSFTGRRGTLIAAGAAVSLMIVFIVAIVLLYDDAPPQAPRRVVADNTPVKQKPTDPGGMEVEHRDKQVFEVANNGGVSSRVELGAQPEQPVDEIPNIPEDTIGTATAGAIDAIGDLAEAAVDSTQSKPELKQSVAAVRDNNAEPASKPIQTEKETAVVPAPVSNTPAATGQYRLQLGAYGSQETAVAAWQTTRGKFLNQLRDLTPEYEPVQAGDRTLFRLRVGPLATRTDADQACIALRAQQQACIVVKP